MYFPKLTGSSFITLGTASKMVTEIQKIRLNQLVLKNR